MKKNFIYIFQKKDNPFEIKIGVTDNIERRLKNLQTGNSKEIVVFYYEEREDAYKIEKKLHRFFEEYRLEKGEWFFIDPITVRKKIFQFV